MSRRPNAPRRGFTLRRALLILAAAALLPAAIFAIRARISRTAPELAPMMHRVERGQFLHEITDRGNVESANNLEIRCEVKSKNAAGTTILEIVPEGSVVKRGDVLVKLDSSALENDRTAQLIVCNNSAAALTQAQKVYETAVIAKREYLEGQFQQAEQTAQNEIFVAQEDLSRAEEYVKYSTRLAAKGYVTPQQLKADRFAVDKARNALEIARTKLEVLRKFTKEKMGVQLDSDIMTAEAKLKAQEVSHKLDVAHLAMIESQIEKCVIKAPQDGQVVYANVTGWRGAKEVIVAAGEMVRERQVIIRLPDPKRMQVVARINEAKVTSVERGMAATIRLDAFPDLELQGLVERVDEFPVPASFFGSSAKQYETTIQIEEPPPGLRPGLTAEVRIRVEQLADALQVPVQAVFEHGDKYYCLAGDGGELAPREVTVGSTNDKTVTVRAGLVEGDEVVLNAAAYREQVALPELPQESEVAGRTKGRPAAEAEQAPAPVADRPGAAAAAVEVADRPLPDPGGAAARPSSRAGENRGRHPPAATRGDARPIEGAGRAAAVSRRTLEDGRPPLPAGKL